MRSWPSSPDETATRQHLEEPPLNLLSLEQVREPALSWAGSFACGGECEDCSSRQDSYMTSSTSAPTPRSSEAETAAAIAEYEAMSPAEQAAVAARTEAGAARARAIGEAVELDPSASDEDFLGALSEVVAKAADQA